MIKKIIIFLIFLLIPNISTAKAPPLGTGSLVPANIMIMLDNSGSMAWDLGGNQLSSSSSLLNWPYWIDHDSKGNLYVMNVPKYYSDKFIQVFEPDGTFVKGIIGYDHISPVDKNKLSGGQWYFDIYKDQIYVVEQSQFNLRVLDLNGNHIRNRRIERVSSGGNEHKPAGIAVTENYIYIGIFNDRQRFSRYYSTSNPGTRAIQIYDRKTLRYIKSAYNVNWNGVQGLKVNNDGTKLLVSSYYFHRVCVHTISGIDIGSCQQIGGNHPGNSRQSWGWYYRGNGYLYSPFAADFDSSGNIYVSDTNNHRVQKFNSSGTHLGTLGGTSANYSGPFYLPTGIVLDDDDNLYVVDSGNKRIRGIDDSNNTLSLSSSMGSPITRMSVAIKVIKRIVSNTELTSAANFGLMEWGHPYVRNSWYPHGLYNSWRYHYYGTRIRVPVGPDGARKIYTDIDNVKAGGGTYLKQALDLAKSYFTGSQSPRILNAKCQANYLIVISDGVWAEHSRVKSAVSNLNNQYQIKTFAVGFAVSGLSSSQKQNYVDVANLGGTGDPLYADNEAEMIAKLTDAIKQVVSGALTFNSPAVMSDKQKGDYIYQSTFNYSKNTQWKGHLKKHKFDSKTGKFVSCDLVTCWDAADKLNKKKYTDRNLWTIGLNDSSLNNFTTSNRTRLKDLLFPRGVYPTTQSAPTDDQTDDLINFIRGIDVYDEDKDNDTTESRHKLSDIYHSNVNIVGVVEGTVSNNDGSTNYDKKDSYYRYHNGYENFKTGNSCGESCSSRTEVVIAGSNGGILHAFNTSDGEELWGYIPPNIIGKLSKMITSKANATNPIYGIDGSATIKDIYFDDTPDDNTINPRWRTVLLSALGAGGHGYFALDITNIKSPKHLFAFENDPFDKIIRFWDSSEAKTEHRYSFAGNLTEEDDYRKLGEAWSTPRIIRIKHNGNDKWVAVVGGGFNGATNPNYGSAVFVIDLENHGKILKRIDIEDSSASNIVNSIPSDLAVITADGTEKANYNGAMVYAADLEGKVTKINLTDLGTAYQTTTLFNAESTNENGRYIYTKPDATIKDSKLWLYFGTGDLQKLQTLTSNVENRLYGIKDKDFPNFEAINPPGTVSQCKTGKNNCPGAQDLGWYVNLDKSKKVTAKPTVDKNLVYFSVYEPKPIANICDVGNAWLYSANTTCGDATARKLGKGVGSEVIVQDNRLIIDISGEADENIESKGNLIILKSTSTGDIGKITEESWKENY
jgi:type IV pilus assembly protein PilY1